MGVISPKIMILLDGGICSQMHQYLLGQLYRNRGYKIAYDLSFYDECGMDKDHKFVRNFDLLKAFPYLELESASVDYFKRSVDYCKKQMAAVPYFYFFSDEPDWVINELVPSLQLTIDNCKVVNINGSDKGYMDLILIARCKHQITSKGTMGKYGALLMDNPQKITILCDDEIEYSWRELLQNPVFL